MLLSRARRIKRWIGMRVDHDDLFAGCGQQVHDGAADTAAAANDEVSARPNAAQTLLRRPLRARDRGADITDEDAGEDRSADHDQHRAHGEDARRGARPPDR